jgi:hypothetical protein
VPPNRIPPPNEETQKYQGAPLRRSRRTRIPPRGAATMININLNATLIDKSMPAREAFEAADLTFSLVNRKAEIEQLYNSIAKPLFENWPNDYTSWLLKGNAYIKLAWAARGGGYINTVTAEGAKEFAEYLAIADQALNRAWELNSKDPLVAVKMISVELGQGQGRDRMEL